MWDPSEKVTQEGRPQTRKDEEKGLRRGKGDGKK